MSIKHIRLSSQAKDQLIRLKTRTGIDQWNILFNQRGFGSYGHQCPKCPFEHHEHFRSRAVCDDE